MDTHKKTVVACRMRVTAEGRIEWEIKTFGTMTAELLKLHDWLSEWGVEQVALESTADYWKPIFNILEDEFEVVLVNAQHVKKVPGRKTDASDAEWLAELMLHGLLKASFIPAKPQRELRELTRYRTTLVRERARLVNRVEKLLESTNIKLSSVVTDVMGVSAKAMLTELAAGASDPQALAELAKGRLRPKIKELEAALTGTVSPNQRFILAQQLSHIDFLDEQIEAMSQQISHHLAQMGRGQGIRIHPANRRRQGCLRPRQRAPTGLAPRHRDGLGLQCRRRPSGARSTGDQSGCSRFLKPDNGTGCTRGQGETGVPPLGSEPEVAPTAVGGMSAACLRRAPEARATRRSNRSRSTHRPPSSPFFRWCVSSLPPRWRR
ncbi:MAG: IS110 family transposase [Rhodospirillales bacterium]|nr:IS110 family transposase [Rhodospirillales bacterium]